MLATGSVGERRVTVFGNSSSVMARSTVQQNMRLYHQVRYSQGRLCQYSILNRSTSYIHHFTN